MEGKGTSLNKEFDFRSWHCGRQGGKIKSKNLDHGTVEGKKGVEFKQRVRF